MSPILKTHINKACHVYPLQEKQEILSLLFSKLFLLLSDNRQEDLNIPDASSWAILTFFLSYLGTCSALFKLSGFGCFDMKLLLFSEACGTLTGVFRTLSGAAIFLWVLSKIFSLASCQGMTYVLEQGRIQSEFDTGWPVWVPKKMSPENKKLNCSH